MARPFRYDKFHPLVKALLVLSALVTSSGVVVLFLGGALSAVGPIMPGTLAAWPQLMVLYGVLAATVLWVSRFFLQREGIGDFGAMGLGLGTGWGKHLLAGFVLGMASPLLIPLVVVVVTGSGQSVHLGWGGHQGLALVIGQFFATASLMALVSIYEEVIFRGMPFQELAMWLGNPVGILLSGVAFGVAHQMLNPSGSAMAALGTGLAGGMLFFAYVKSQRLWLPIGIHWGWNLSLASLMGLPVSGIPFAAPVFQVRMLGPVWLTGGDFGPEAGMAGMVVFLLMGFVLRWLAGRLELVG